MSFTPSLDNPLNQGLLNKPRETAFSHPNIIHPTTHDESTTWSSSSGLSISPMAGRCESDGTDAWPSKSILKRAVASQQVPGDTQLNSAHQDQIPSRPSISLVPIDLPYIQTDWHHTLVAHHHVCSGNEPPIPLPPVVFASQMQSTTHSVPLDDLTRMNLQARFNKLLSNDSGLALAFALDDGVQKSAVDQSNTSKPPLKAKRDCQKSQVEKGKEAVLDKHPLVDGNDQVTNSRKRKEKLEPNRCSTQPKARRLGDGDITERRECQTSLVPITNHTRGRQSSVTSVSGNHGVRSHDHDHHKQIPPHSPISPTKLKLLAIEWANVLNAVEYLHAQGKWDCHAKENLHHALTLTDAYKLSFTKQLLRETKICVAVQKVINNGGYSYAVREQAQRIYGAWVNLI
ncbi:hypothetical protein FPV67DRAFT_1470345 [Lyophyllum atratum]|nr:hypothetical protein FPV67DRAFT_1470345 [Lyophyllum atratum]